MTLYLLALGIQQDLIKQRCFGDCGKVAIGVISIDDFGEFVPCRQDDCPYLDNQMSLDDAEVVGESPVWIRKIK